MPFRRSLTIALLGFVLAGCGAEERAADDASGDAAATAGAEPGETSEARSDVTERVIEAWRENAEGVAGYVVVEETDGQVDTTRYEKVEIEGLPSFRPVGSASAPDSAAQPVMMALLREARSAGAGEVAGEETDVLVLDDPAAIREVMGARMNGTFEPERLEFQVGSDGLPRRMTMVGTARLPSGESPPITTEVTLTDWRRVDGFAHPFRRVTRLEGMGAVADAAAGQAMAEMERRMEGMPEAQKEQARQMIRQRLEAMRGASETVTVTRSLEVERE